MIDGILIVFGLLAGAVALFAWGRPRTDVVAILMVLAMILSGVLTPQESLAGFCDPVVMLIAAVAIGGEVTEFLRSTGYPNKRVASDILTFRNSLYASNRCGNASDRIDYKAHCNKLVQDKLRTEHRWFGYLVSSDAYRDLRASFELVLARDPAVPR